MKTYLHELVLTLRGGHPEVTKGIFREEKELKKEIRVICQILEENVAGYSYTAD